MIYQIGQHHDHLQKVPKNNSIETAYFSKNLFLEKEIWLTDAC